MNRPFQHKHLTVRHPVSDRLTDEQWRWMLEAAPPPLPEWTSDYRVAK